jgi:hypothetical protein
MHLPSERFHSKNRRGSVVKTAAFMASSLNDFALADQYGYLPLHCAVVSHASPTILDQILFAYPQAVFVPDHDGNLPIHLAMLFQNRVSNVDVLIRRFGGGLLGKNADGKTPIQLAMQHHPCTEVIVLLATTDTKMSWQYVLSHRNTSHIVSAVLSSCESTDAMRKMANTVDRAPPSPHFCVHTRKHDAV